MTSTIDLLAGATTPPESGNFMARIEELERRVESLTTRTRSVNSLDEFAADLGMIQYGEFRSGNDREPGDGFSGSRIGYPGFLYNSEEYAWALVNEDVLEIGFSLTSKKAVFASGNATIGADGIVINQMSYLIQHTATDGITERIGSLGMWAEPGGTEPCYGFSLNTPADETDIMDGTNAGFESGDFTGWTKTTETNGSWTMYSASTSTWNIFEGTYMPFFEAGLTSSAITGVLTKSRDEVTAGTKYLIHFGLAVSSYGVAYGKVEVKWYDHASAGSLIKTDQIAYQSTNSFPSLTTHNAYVTAPSGALSCEIVVTGYSAARTNNFLTVSVDGFTMNATSISANLYFDSTGELNLNDNPILPKHCYISGLAVASNATLTLITSGGTSYNYVAADDANNGDTYTYQVPPLAAGTYAVYFCGAKAKGGGKVDWTLDGTSVVTGQDWYAGSAADYTYTVTGVAVSSGAHTLLGTINGKNASSSDYVLKIYSIVFVKTA